MTETERIRDQLRRALDGESWHGPALLPLLTGLTAEQAARRPIAGAHSVWELVGHLSATQDEVARRLAGAPAGPAVTADDWPPVPEGGGEAAWGRALEELGAGARRLDAALAATGEERLEEAVQGRDYSVYVLLQGLVQHHLYHAGQVALLKRALGLEPV